MADKLTQQITEALTRCAAHAGGVPLYSSKSDAGLFANTASAKPAAQKCLADELIRAIGTDAKGKTARELYGLTDKGWEYLLAAVNPKQVLEDFVRVLEARQGEVGELLDTARRMAESLHGLKEAVSRVLPAVSEARVERGELSAASLPSPLAGEGGRRFADRVRGSFATEVGPDPSPSSLREPPSPARGEGEEAAVALLDAPVTQLAPAILARLAEHSGPTDCTLPELFRAIPDAPTIGEFHDCLRELCAKGAVSLHSWTGPLYALPEPQYALLIGHGIAYYASLRG